MRLQLLVFSVYLSYADFFRWYLRNLKKLMELMVKQTTGFQGDSTIRYNSLFGYSVVGFDELWVEIINSCDSIAF